MAIDNGDIQASLVLNIKKFLDSIKEATQGIDNMVDDVSDGLSDMEDNAESSFDGMNVLAGTFGAGLSAVGASIGASLISMVNDFNSTEKSLNSFSAQTGITGKELDKFKGKIEETYLKGYGEDIQEVSNIYSKFQRELKLSADETQLLTDKAFQLRDVFGYEVEDSLRGSSSLIKQFGIDGTKAYDLIAKASQLAGDRADDLIDTIDEYSFYFKQAGFSAEEMTKLLVDGVNNGARNFDILGDAVKEFSVILLGSGEEGVQIFADIFGSSKKAKDMIEKVSSGQLSLKDAMQLTANELSKMDNTIEQNTLGVSAFGTLWEEVGSKNLTSILNNNKALTDFDGTLEKANGTLKSQGKTMEQVSREFQQLTNQVGAELAPALSQFLELASKIIFKLLEFSKANPIFVKIVAVLGVLISILGTIAGAIIAIGAFITPILAGFELLAGVISTVGAVIGAIAAGIISLPVIIGVAIVALVALIIWKWDEIKKFTIDTWNAIVEFILSVPEILSNAWVSFVEFILGLWDRFKIANMIVWQNILNFIKSIPNKLYTFFTSTLPMITGYILGRWVKMQITFYTKAYEFFTVTIPNIVKSFWQFIKNVFTVYIPQIILQIGIFVLKAFIKFQEMKTKLEAKAKEIVISVINWFKQLPSRLLALGGQLLISGSSLGKKLKDGIINTIKNLPQLIKNVIVNAINGVGKLGSTAYSALKNIGNSMWTGFKKGLGINSPSYLEKAMFAINDEGENMKNSLFSTFRQLRSLPQINSLAELTKQQKQLGNNDNSKKVTQNFNSPLVQIVGGNETTAQRTAYNLYDLITFNKRALGVE